MYYYEQLNILSVWSPRTAADRPTEVTAGGTKIKIRRVTEMPDYMKSKTLTELKAWSDSLQPPGAVEGVETLDEASG